ATLQKRGIMIIGILKEIHPRESRVALIPDHVAKLVKAGAEIQVESGIGHSVNMPDEAYSVVGAKVAADRQSLLSDADLVLSIRGPSREDVGRLKRDTISVSLLDPFNEKTLIEALRDQNVSAISLEMIPRTTRAQKMDVLSSQANLAGYVAVILAAERLNKIFPMMMTPAGTISPARVFIIGAGVAGLQAIATAKRLGARVEAFDTRAVVEEQVKSLGARFVKIDLGETGQTQEGYAKALTEEQLARQREGMTRICAASDVVITTAQVFGRRAPLIITEAMVRSMAKGSVIVDLAVESGGNVAGSRLDEEVDSAGVRIIGLANLPGRVALHASQMFSANMFNLISDFWDPERSRFRLNFDDEIIAGCVITHQGKIVNETISKHYSG
ncbi:MAG: Re/Si-specific NAD(P)(+) transhydrogenase subunit alpha, partial [Desulfoferrobacter sp.]